MPLGSPVPAVVTVDAVLTAGVKMHKGGFPHSVSIGTVTNLLVWRALLPAQTPWMRVSAGPAQQRDGGKIQGDVRFQGCLVLTIRAAPWPSDTGNGSWLQCIAMQEFSEC